MFRIFFLLVAFAGLFPAVVAQKAPVALPEKYIADNEQRHIQELIEFVSIPSISSLPAHKDDVARAAQWLKTKLLAIGMGSAEVMPTEGHPVVYGKWNNAKGKPTVLIYGHYDVQPVDETKWASLPFTPKVENGRIYGRGASDDKGSVIISIWAVEALLKQNGKLPVNVKFLFEGEEEIGSPGLWKFAADHKDLLRADHAYCADAAQKSDTLAAMTMSTKGACTMEFALKTANRDLHSGVYGGRLPNAAVALAEIISSFHTPDGKVAVDGFYDKVQPMTDEEKQMAATVPYDEQRELKENGAIAYTGEKGYSSQERAWYRPTLEITGMWSGYTAEEGFLNIVPASAHCRVMCRLVAAQDGKEILQLIKRHIDSHLPVGVAVSYKLWPGFTPAAKFTSNTPAFKAAVAVLTQLYGRPPMIKGAGGTNAALSVLQQELGLQAYSFGFLQDDENFHSHNEFMRVSDLEKGQRAYCMLLTLLGK